jgi:uncharacterized membrane protein YqgA involved in biofilm formation
METENRRIDIKSLLLGALVGASIVLSVAATTTSRNRAIWEYKLVQGAVWGNDATLDNGINSQVAQGWDFVSASHSTEHYGFAVMRREKK